ncbi:MAG: hypothetical protein ACJ71W_21820 [Terriglobales bacterium]
MPTRSELIFRASAQIPSRFVLVMAVARATRTIHLPRTRVGDTINRVLTMAGESTASILSVEPLGPVAFVEEDPYFAEMAKAASR